MLDEAISGDDDDVSGDSAGVNGGFLQHEYLVIFTAAFNILLEKHCFIYFFLWVQFSVVLVLMFVSNILG